MWGAHDIGKLADHSRAAAIADRRLAKLERFLAASFAQAIEGARTLYSDKLVGELIEAAGSRGVFAKAAPVKPDWYEDGFSRLALLGRPAALVWVDPGRFMLRWKPVADLAAKPVQSMLDGIAAQVEAGAMLSPPVVARLPGDDWAFLEGRMRFVYAVAADADRMPLAMPAGDEAAFRKEFKAALFIGATPRASMPGGLDIPRNEAAGRPSHLVEAIETAAVAAGNRFASAIVAAAVACGELEMRRIGDLLAARAKKLDVSIDFSTPNYNAVNELQLSALNLIREFTVEQREVVLAALRDGVARGLNPVELSRIFRDTVGLTSVQSGYVANYRRALERLHLDNGAKVNALQRALRDGRFDRTVIAAARNGSALSAAQIDTMVGRYRERWIAYRARTIGRTQALRAAHMGELAAWEASIANGDINAAEVIQTWETARDERVRFSHRTLQGQQRRFGEPFQSYSGAELRFPGDPEAPPEEVINCRCVLTRQLTEQPLPVGEATPGRLALQTPNYEGLAAESGGGRIAEGGRGFGLSPGAALDTRYRVGGLADDAATVLDTLSSAEISQLVQAYERQLATKLSQDVSAYMSALAKDIPKGAKAIGKTIAMKDGVISLNAREALRSSSTVLRIAIPQNQAVLFTDAARQTLALPPGTKFVVRSINRMPADEYFRQFGGTGNFKIRSPGKVGIQLVEVDIVPGSGLGTIEEFLAALRAELAAREAGLAAIEREIADNLATRAATEPKPIAAYSPQKGGASWNAYMRPAPGANDLGRQTLSSLKPIDVVVDKVPSYQTGLIGVQRAEVAVLEAKPSSEAARLIFRHELGHRVDNLGGNTLVGSQFYSAKLADEVTALHEAWRRAIDVSPGVQLASRRDVARYLARKVGIPVEELLAGEAPLVDRYLASVVTRFTRQTGFDPGKLVGGDLINQAEFAGAVLDGNIARVARAIGERHSFVAPGSWSERDALAHMLYDLIGSATRLEYGGGHSLQYYLEKSVTLRNKLPGGQTSILTDSNTSEVFANWFALYTSGPGERGLLRALLPDLNAKFEAYLATFGRGLLGGLLG